MRHRPWQVLTVCQPQCSCSNARRSAQASEPHPTRHVLHYPRFRERDTEAQRGQKPRRKVRGQDLVEPALKPRQAGTGAPAKGQKEARPARGPASDPQRRGDRWFIKPDSEQVQTRDTAGKGAAVKQKQAEKRSRRGPSSRVGTCWASGR